ncbi:MAG: ferritin family protein [Phycisphaerae bacterium]|nr:ferritin family protein [Phycisphaerae bacterium]NIX29967.1 rubrerythrin [Phycisphaerae bacterium]
MGFVDIQEALKASAQTEKDAMDFYKYGAEKMQDEKAKAMFEMLAKEEMEHARSFYDACMGDGLAPFEEFIASPPDTESSWWKALKEAMLGDFDERKAMELAIEQEDALEKELLEMAAKIDDPAVKEIYLANAKSTHRHEEMIEEDYHAIYG